MPEKSEAPPVLIGHRRQLLRVTGLFGSEVCSAPNLFVEVEHIHHVAERRRIDRNVGVVVTELERDPGFYCYHCRSSLGANDRYSLCKESSRLRRTRQSLSGHKSKACCTVRLIPRRQRMPCQTHPERRAPQKRV